MSATIEETMLALEYVENGKQKEMKALAIISGTVAGVGMETFSRVLVDYLAQCATDEQNQTMLRNIAFDIGVFDEE